jgi:hypothetical protein
MAGSGCRIGWVHLLPLYALLGGCAWFEEPPATSVKEPPRRVATAVRAPGAKPVSPPPQQPAPVQTGRGCQDLQACQAQLRVLVESPDRRWMQRAETPEEVLTGVRIFAYRALRRRLSCDELGVALQQLTAVPTTLRTPPSGSTPQEIERASRLAAEVQGELSSEKGNRCAAPARPAAPSVQPPASAPAPQPPPPVSAPSEPKQ